MEYLDIRYNEREKKKYNHKIIIKYKTHESLKSIPASRVVNLTKLNPIKTVS